MIIKDREATLRNVNALDGKPVIFSADGKKYLGNLCGNDLRKLFNIYELTPDDEHFFKSRGVEEYDSGKWLRDSGIMDTAPSKKGFSLAQSIIDDMVEKDYHDDVVEKTNFHAGVDDLRINQYSTYEDNWVKPNYGATEVKQPVLDHNPNMVSDIRDITCFKVIKSNGSIYTVDDGMSQFTCSYEFLKKLKASGSVIDCTEPMYMHVARKYAAPERKYHNIDHIELMLHFLNQYSLALTEHEYETLKTAILFHDVVYSYKDSEVNELRSAEEYMRYIQNSPFGEKFNPEVVSLIMATKWHFSPFYQPTTKLEKFMLDADLITFTFEYSDFVYYNSLITDEVIAMVGESKKAEILKARKAFMQAIYDNNSLKFHCDFNKIAEPTAYNNIKQYLKDFDILNGE